MFHYHMKETYKKTNNDWKSKKHTTKKFGVHDILEQIFDILHYLKRTHCACLSIKPIIHQKIKIFTIDQVQNINILWLSKWDLTSQHKNISILEMTQTNHLNSFVNLIYKDYNYEKYQHFHELKSLSCDIVQDTEDDIEIFSRKIWKRNGKK